MDGRSKDMGWISQILTGLTFIAKTAVVARSRRMVVITVDSHSGCPVHTDSVTAQVQKQSIGYFFTRRVVFGPL
jgi:hypothetical protein